MNSIPKILVSFLLCCLLGTAIGYVFYHNQASIKNLSIFNPLVYESQNATLKSNYLSEKYAELGWSQLLPEQERIVLERFQQKPATTVSDLTNNILLSIEAASDTSYSSAMLSTNTVDTFEDQSVSISGFIVPIDYYESTNLHNVFIVPYFGACIHFPPPPPNQIIYAQLEEGFSDFELTQAYNLKGILKRGLFEDPLGTSAYILEVVSIEPYDENPDDLRPH